MLSLCLFTVQEAKQAESTLRPACRTTRTQSTSKNLTEARTEVIRIK